MSNKIGIYFGSTTDTTRGLANIVANIMGIESDDVHDVATAAADSALNYDTLLIGCSTWGYGDLQDDMEFFLPKLAKLDLTGKKVGLFGSGDSRSFSATFCNALAEIKDELTPTGCTFIGTVPAEGYNYEDTLCEENGRLIGLLVDEMHESQMTPDRLTHWITSIKKDL